MPTTTVNDIEVHYELRGTGEPLVLLHGFFGSSADWIHLFDLDDLARRHTLVLPDARGHGRSTNPSGTFTHGQCARDLLALLDRLNIDRFKAVGLSLGGNAMLHAATLAPERVRAMVLIGATSYYPASARAIMATFTEETRTADEWRSMRERHKLGDAQIRALWRIANAFKDDRDDMAFTPPRLAAIPTRTLIVTGDRDPLYPLEIFVEQYRAMPNADLYVIPGSGHDAVFGAARPDFVRTATTFLAASG
jgi:pimeloyl-ACP methyl ester carboxylesterase